MADPTSIKSNLHAAFVTFDGRRELIDRIPAELATNIVAELQRDGADLDAALRGVVDIAKAVATYVSLGRFVPIPADEVRKQMKAVASAAKRLRDAARSRSVLARVRHKIALQPRTRGLFGSRPTLGNPDPIYDQRGNTLSDVLNAKVIVPADMHAKFERVLSDLEQLVPELERATVFKAKRGRQENWYARNLLHDAIEAWVGATGRAPTAGQQDGIATAPLLKCLRMLVNCLTEDQDVREAVSDDRYLDVLADLKRPSAFSLSSRVQIPVRRATGNSG